MKKVLLTVFTLILSIIIFEVYLRFSPYKHGTSPVEYDENIGMWHKKNFSSIIKQKCYETSYAFDNEGRLENMYIYNKSKKDIILLGDSFIESLMIQSKYRMNNILYKEIKGQYNVLNYALSGTGPVQQWQILKNKVKLKNTITIVHFIFIENDLGDSVKISNSSLSRPKVYVEFRGLENYKLMPPSAYNIKEKVRNLLASLELYGYLKSTIYYYKNLIQKNENKVLKTKKVYKKSSEKYKWEQMLGAIYQIKKLTDKYNVSYKIAIYSDNEFRNGNKAYTRELENFLKKYNIKYINLVPFLQEEQKQHKLSFSCDSHWNSKTICALTHYLKKAWF